jgi:nucleoside-diphosphate-sugar epimerase
MSSEPIVLITGAGGNLGRALADALKADYRIVGLDLAASDKAFPILAADMTDAASLKQALDRVAEDYGTRIASVIHLAAYFDFTGEESPRYEAVNVEGTRNLLNALQTFDVEQFLYTSTMLVHAPGRAGEAIDEMQPIDPRWAYPKSKARAETAIAEAHGRIPYVILRLAGVYDERTTVPTMAQQMARIYEGDLQSHLYSGSTLTGQTMLHREDMIDAIKRAVDRRASLESGTALLIGEPHAMSYDAIQDELGHLLHGASHWLTLRVTKPIAAAGAKALEVMEKVVPDVIDRGKEPFIKPFMVQMADDHYALDIRRAVDLLGWRPQHRLKDELAKMAAALKADPAGWYRAQKIPLPPFVAEAAARGEHPETLRVADVAVSREEHRQSRWAHLVNMALGAWLVTQPALIGVSEEWLAHSEMACGVALIIVAFASLPRGVAWTRWAAAAIGAVIMALPFLFWTTNAAAYLSDTLVGMLAFGLAVSLKPEPGPSAIASLRGPEIPPGWSYNPSAWSQRLPIIFLALIGLFIARYLAGYQLGHIPGVWEPFFAGSPTDPKNGTEEIITSAVSEAWPVSDAAVGAYTYALEILTGIVGSRARWRTMPWLVILFGLMIAPLGIVSIYFVIIQPVVIGTWSTLALIGAGAVLIQIPYSLDELLAAGDFVRRRVKAGANVVRILFRGDADEGQAPAPGSEFERDAGAFMRDMVSGGVSLPWNYAAAALIGLMLLFTRPLVGAAGALANADHVIGALVLTTISIAAAEVARPARFFNMLLGAALIAAPFVADAGAAAIGVRFVLGAALIALSIRCGPLRTAYGAWSKYIR